MKGLSVVTGSCFGTAGNKGGMTSREQSQTRPNWCLGTYLIFVTDTTGGACVIFFVRCKILFIEHENGPCILQMLCNLHKMCKTVYDFHGVIKHLVCSFAYSM